MVRSLFVASALIRSDTVTSHTMLKAMSPPRIAPGDQHREDPTGHREHAARCAPRRAR